ncbi:MAG: DNA repair exonuclease [Ignisphaera sp.]
MLALHVSDTHLGAIQYGLLSRAKDVYSAFGETIEIALRERVDLYIHAGDFFDSPNPPPEAYIVAYKGLKKLKEKNIKVVVIAGQHDIPKRYSTSPLHMLQDLNTVDALAISEIVQRDIDAGQNKKIHLVLVPYPQRHSISKLVKPLANNTKTVIVAHLLLKELGIPSEYADISLSQFPNWANYIALGDYHIKTDFRHGSCYVVYPGATEVFRVNECCEKYVALIDLDLDYPSPQYIKLSSTRPWIRITYRDFQKFQNELSAILSEIRKQSSKQPMVIVEMLGSNIEVLEKYLLSLRSNGEIEFFRIVSSDEKSKETTTQKPVTEDLEYLDLQKIMESIVKDHELATLLTNLAREPSKAIATKIIDYLKERPEIAKKIEMEFNTNSLTMFMKNKAKQLR